MMVNKRDKTKVGKDTADISSRVHRYTCWEVKVKLLQGVSQDGREYFSNMNSANHLK